MKKVLFLLPCLIAQALAGDHASAPKDNNFDGIRASAYFIPQAYLGYLAYKGLSKRQMSYTTGEWDVKNEYAREELAGRLLLSYGIQTVLGCLKVIKLPEREDSAKNPEPLNKKDANIPDKGIAAAIMLAAVVQSVTDSRPKSTGWFSSPHSDPTVIARGVVRAAVKAGMIEGLENGMISVAQTINNKYGLVNENSWHGALIQGSGLCGVQWASRTIVDLIIDWPVLELKFKRTPTRPS